MGNNPQMVFAPYCELVKPKTQSGSGTSSRLPLPLARSLQSDEELGHLRKAVLYSKATEQMRRSGCFPKADLEWCSALCQQKK
jgi:hypothetical protein